MNMKAESLRNLLYIGGEVILGSDLKDLIMTAKDSSDDLEVVIAEQLIDDYYSSANGNVEPLPAVYYSLWENRDGQVRIARNNELSPKAASFMNLNSDYFRGITKGSKFDGTMDLRVVITMNISIKGNQLQQLCNDILAVEENESDEVGSPQYLVYQKQLARYILNNFYRADSKLAPRDTIYYKVRLQSTGIPQVVRDVKLSPRPLSAAEREWNAAHPEDI